MKANPATSFLIFTGLLAATSSAWLTTTPLAPFRTTTVNVPQAIHLPPSHPAFSSSRASPRSLALHGYFAHGEHAVADDADTWLPTPTPWDEAAAQDLLDQLVTLQETTNVGTLLDSCLKDITDEVTYRDYPDRSEFWEPYADGTLTMRDFFNEWVRYSPVPEAPKPGEVPDSPGYYITYWDYLANTESGLYLCNEQQDFKNWFVRFLDMHGQWINSPDSTGTIKQWLAYNGTTEHPFDINQYVVPPQGFQSFNQFFLRQLKDPSTERPIEGYHNPKIINSPNDGGTFFLENGGVLPSKSGDRYDVEDAFPHHGKSFVNGTLLDSLLWFTDYHHFKSPVNGTVIFMGQYNGSYNYDFDNFDPTDPYHPGPGPDSDRVGWYNNLPKHKRFNWVIDTHDPDIGLVGMSAIGFWGVGAINNTIPYMGYKVTKGEAMGNFNYGGSSIVLAFEPKANDMIWKTQDDESIQNPDFPTLVNASEQIGYVPS